ncbi:MAG: hypothetical protein IH621_12450 [Krumholzibacteria bacterium]|nr:hypothetical protein [Candidatus Krumholzibacteria bacterium]
MPRFVRRLALLAFLAWACPPIVPPVRAGEPPAVGARAGLDLATDAARIWAPDARLVYLENDEDLTGQGTAARWGYLYYSPERDAARGYTVRQGRIAEAADLGFAFPAPPLPETWIDSGAAVAAAEQEHGRRFRQEQGGRLGSALLIRGALHDQRPDAATWAVVYVSDTGAPLTVVVDAATGKVVRTWRG